MRENCLPDTDVRGTVITKDFSRKRHAWRISHKEA